MQGPRRGIILAGHAGKKPALQMSARNRQKTMHEEIEIKLRVGDRAALLRQLGKLKARLRVPRSHEMNTLYDTADGALARAGQMLRIRVDRYAPRAGKRSAIRKGRAQRAVLTYKGPVQPLETEAGADHGTSSKHRAYKIRQEREVSVTDADGMAAILEAVGLRPCFRYEKYRSTYSMAVAKGLKVELDETPVGIFVELEGETEAIDRAAALLGYGPSDYITKSYGLLWLEQNGMAEGDARGNARGGAHDMLF